jgi:ribosome maturation factor RimP
MKRDEVVSRIEAIAEQVAMPQNIEIVEVELKGSGRSHLLRIYIDKPEGVTHADCEFISRGVSEALDLEDPLPGSYDLEVSSPGVERKLGKWKDWERFTGKKVKVALKVTQQDPAEVKNLDGRIVQVADKTITLEVAAGRQVTFPFDQVDQASLKFEW